MKVWTPVEANRALPLVRQIVGDILERGKDLRSLHEKEHRSADDEYRLQQLTGQIEELRGELLEIGCDYKDWGFEKGLVDFPGYIDGEPVLLCWSTEEIAVTWYHGVLDGFAGRKPIPALDLSEQPHPPVDS